MLYLTRREGEAVIINNEITVRVVELRGRTVKLGLTFPRGASVLREEVFLQIRSANEAASRSAAALDPQSEGETETGAPAGAREP
ncbi:MAG: carbon storage regulator [Geminicoccaceae bacterium]|nr:carbon storage regulator [Geminicoccaceae bacterium]MCX8100469.1 carbon storage regulator [Geminicoccaceae bacterium]MDW8370485.1 carbon storage regulator [Geminicoccaceae bacterium]